MLRFFWQSWSSGGFGLRFEGQIRRQTYSFAEAGQAIGVSAKTIGRMVAEKRIRTVLVGAKPRIPLAEIERFGRSPRGGQ